MVAIGKDEDRLADVAMNVPLLLEACGNPDKRGHLTEQPLSIAYHAYFPSNTRQ
jgi:hypothetical protein